MDAGEAATWRGSVDLSLVTDTLPSAVLFDMDGTLIDSEMYWLAAERDLVEQFGGEWTIESSSELVGSSLDRTAAILIQAGVALPVDEVITRLSHAVKRRVEETLPWRPGAAEFLGAVRRAGVRTALVTMSYSLNAQDFARKATGLLGFPVFDAVVAGDDVRRGKPDPEPYRMAAERLGVDVRECVVVEDSIPGVTSAMAAGAATIGVPLFHDLTAFAGVQIWETLEGRGIDALASAYAMGRAGRR